MNNRILRLEFEVAKSFLQGHSLTHEEDKVKIGASGVRGVHRGKDKWVANAMIDGKKVYLGLYETVEHASQAVEAKRNIKKELVG